MESKHNPISRIIDRLRTADKGHLTYFDTEKQLNSAKEITKVVDFIRKECEYFSYNILKRFVWESGCGILVVHS